MQAVQDRITDERNRDRIGSEASVLVDLVEEGRAVARSHREAPEIDGVVLLDRGEPGDWLDVRITGAYGPELIGEVMP